MATGKPILIFDNHLTSTCYFGPRPTALAFGLCHKFNPMATSPKPTAKSRGQVQTGAPTRGGIEEVVGVVGAEQVAE
jgi:hypothetical protein